MTSQRSNNFLALDVGAVRIGLAIASDQARLPRPLMALDAGEMLWTELDKVIAQEEIGIIIVGLPRNLSGDATDQTRIVEAFVSQLKKHYDLPIYLQDEALTSRQAEEELRQTGRPYTKGDIDALAATYILTDFLHEGASRE
jgi:putative holliday junction resolvase